MINARIFQDYKQRRIALQKHPTTIGTFKGFPPTDVFNFRTLKRKSSGDGYESMIRDEDEAAELITTNPPDFGINKRFIVRYEQNHRLYMEFTNADQQGLHKIMFNKTKTQGGHRLLFLPWHGDVISYMQIEPNNIHAKFFMTGPLNGCHVYVTKHHNRIRVFHANSNAMGKKKKKPNLSEKYMCSLLRKVRHIRRHGGSITHCLKKDDYMLYKKNPIKPNEEILTGLGQATMKMKNKLNLFKLNPKTSGEIANTQAIVIGQKINNEWTFSFHAVLMVDYGRLRFKIFSLIDEANLPQSPGCNSCGI